MFSESVITKCVDFVLRRKTVWLLSIAVVSGCLLFSLPQLVIDGSIERIMLKDGPENVFHEHAKELFGTDEVISIVINSDDTVWEPGKLRQLEQLSETLAELEGVVDVFGLTNYRLVDSQYGMLTTSSISQRLAEGASVDELRTLADSDPAVRNNLVSEDGLNAAINLRLQPQAEARLGMQRELVQQVRDTLQQISGSERFHLAGWPVIKADLTNYMERDLRVLLPVMAVVISVLLMLSFRRIAGVVLPLAAIGTAQIWTIGGMVVTGHAMTIVTNSLPIIIIAIGTTYCIFVASAIFQGIDAGKDRPTAIRLALQKTGLSVVLSGFTTMVGFAALKMNHLEVIDEFGTIAVWGVMVSILMALVFMPCLALFVPIRPRTPSANPRVASWDRFLDRVLANRRIIWAGTILVVVVSGFAIMRIRVDTAPVGWFPRTSETRLAVDYANQHMAGITPYNILLESDKAGTFQDPEMLTRIAGLQRWLESQADVDTTYSIADVNKVLFRALGGDASWYRIPDDRAGVAQVMMLARSENIEGLDTLITDDGRAANILARSSLLGSEAGVEFAQRVDEYLAQHFSDLKIKKITGNAHLTYLTNIQFTSGLASSLAVGMGAICLVMMLLFRSVKLGLLAMIPNMIPVAVNYAMLGLVDISLNAATSITGCIAIGIAVDDTIHFMVTYRKKLTELNDVQAAIHATLNAVGRPMMTTSVILCCGFSVLMLSNFLPVISLGLLVAVTMVVCLLCDLVFLPVLLTAKMPVLSLPRSRRVASVVAKLAFGRSTV
ncbi:efflux RND transporter permease subunit [Aporhodopirellula aestuarii]|uniref:MMPL family transporter n=1 Tax=Aporhodopirellula aestuarii TaxID=2950107 RepID=A0ABT0U3R5_9BACT|nr:MMPL family transporter [Aporhodopirellula aestuarii]MCM2371555.1 MMPL family transporter [Aporhodopirellula aestuarii]